MCKSGMRSSKVAQILDQRGYKTYNVVNGFICSEDVEPSCWKTSGCQFYKIMFIAGLLASFFMGTVLSFLGAGGSILTLPILVYLFQIDIIQATTYSLLLVGLTAVFGCVASFKIS